MANPTRFVSVNLNKSYGKQPARSSSSSSPAPLPYANGGIGSRGRFAGTGGRGMVVLSRARGAAPSGQKAGAKLSVPAPLNLPSLRKEHERFDPAAASGSTPGPGASALGSGHSSSAMGWSKPATADGARDPTGIGEREPPYATQRAASAGTGMVSGASERAVLLRGEDFPSLKATFLVGQKQKDAAGQKQRIAVQQQQQQQSEERAERPSSEPTLTMRPHVRNPRYADFKESNDEESATGEKGSEEKLQKLDGFLSGPIPLIQFKHTSDWADDERDTSHGIPDKGRVRGFSRVESGKGYDYLDMGGALERDFGRVDSFDRDVHTPGRSANSWRSPLHSREGFNTRESGLDRDGHGLRFSNHNRDVNKDSVKYGHSMYGDSSSEGPRSGHAEQHHSWRSLGHGQNLQTARINVVMLDARHTEQGEHDLQFDASSNRYKGGPFLKNNSSKQLSTRGISSDDPVLKFGRDNRNNSSNGKVSLENLATESRDLFSGGMSVDANSKISRRKKDTSKQVDFYDPVRESFEAELERVQKFQEEERQRALQEHARVLELARKEEEERERRVREEEERRRRHEEEAREAAWRAEQERLATAKRAEEQRLAREEEKKSILAEEERRKEAARQKLLELEAKIAKRQAEDASKDNQLPVRSAEHQVSEMKESDDVKVPGNDYWEEGERVVQHVTNSAVSEPAVSTRFIVPGPNFPLSMEGNPPLIEKGKLMNSWKNEAYDHVNNSSVFLQQENELQITKQDAFGSGRVLPRKGFLGGQGPSHLRPSSRSAVLDSTHSVGDYHLPKGQHWTNSSQGDRYNRNAFIDHDLESGKYDLGWDQSPLRGSSQVIYAQNISPRSESDGYSNPLRSRYSLRQPRVFPPPSITSVRRCSLKDGPEQPSLSVFERENMNRTAGSRHENQAYESEDHHEESEYLDISSSKENACVLQNDKDASRCGSQSSLSVSNPPTSPTHLSHDDFVDSADFPSLPASADGRPVTFSDGEHAMARPELDKANLTMASSSLPSGEEEWSIGNNGEMLDQEEYDEDEIYHEEVDHHEGDENTIHIGEDFDLSTELQNLGVEMEHDQKVLGFNDGVEVIIPNDDFDETSVDTRKNVDVEVAPKDATLRLGSSDGAISNGDDLDLEIAFPVEVGSTTILLNDTEKAFHGLVLEPATSTTTSFAMKNSELSPVTSDQTYATSAFDLPELSSTPGRPAPSSASTVHDQVEAPTKLHFDLFSGPSLIQSPIPAIQIGSIQMPLNINSPIGPPHVHPPQPPFFQFGQLRYSSPVSQGILPISSQSIPYTPSPVPLVHFSSHQNFARSYSNTGILSVSTQNVSSMSVPNKPNYGKKYTEDPNKPEFSQSSALHANQHKVALSSQDLAECFPSQGNQITSELDTSMKIPENPVNVSKGYSISMDEKNHPPVEPQTGNKSSQFLNGDKSFHRSRTSGSIMAGRGKKYIYTVKNRGPRQQFSGLDIPRVEFGIDRRIRRNIRRTEFRVRENNYKRFDNSDASIYIGQDDKPSSSGSSFVPSSKHASKRDITYSKLSRLTIEPESLNIAYRNVQTALFDGRKKSGKESLTNMSTPSMINSQFEDRNFKRSATIEEDVDAPLQSGVVRIFKQPGIEAPSDEDDFIEVRSKRQMLHDRREQREKEIKAKSREAKAPRKTRPVYQANSVSSKLGKVVNGDISKSVSASFPIELAGFPSGGQSTAFSVNTVSQPLAPVGTPTVIADNDVRPLIKKSGGASTVMVNSSGVKTDLLAKSCLERVIPFENATPLTSWSDVHMNQQVMALTQKQLEEAMNPERFDTSGALVAEHGAMAKDQEKSSSIANQDKSFSTSGSPLSSLLAGERIQFGAVTTPSFIPSVSRAIPNGFGCHALASCKTESFRERLTTSEIDHTLFFDEGKHHADSCVHLEDSEAEAEAAASAVAVAAISSDEVVNNDLNVTSGSISDSEKFGNADACGLTSQGVRSNGEVRNISIGEESLPVTLPADLSVETPVPLWPALPNPQSTSSTMFSQFPGPPPSQFPCFEMNPMLRGPIFTFSPQNESGSTQPQPQRSTALGPGPLGAWSHSGMDSFYGPPAGFAGHFISPPAGMPAVQAPPQMVFYNHFPTLAPFGVGIMGTTFISSGKQPDWKHNPTSSATSINEGDNGNLATCSPQLIPPSMPPSLQHLSPASPLVPMASHLPMFDLSPFQSTVDVPVQARWSHMPPAPLHGMPFSPLPRTQVDGGMPLDMGQKIANLPPGSNKFPETRSATAEADAKFTFSTDSAAHFPDELGLLDCPVSVASHASGSGPSYSTLRGNTSDDKGPNVGKNFARSSGGSSRASIGIVSGSNSASSNGINHGSISTSKPQIAPQQSTTITHQPHHPVGYSDKRGASSSQKMASGGDWLRRAGFQGRSHAPSGSERNFPSSKMKQIYVAKSPATGAPNTG